MDLEELYNDDIRWRDSNRRISCFGFDPLILLVFPLGLIGLAREAGTLYFVLLGLLVAAIIFTFFAGYYSLVEMIKIMRMRYIQGVVWKIK